MRILRISILLVLFLCSAVLAKPKYVPDYFPTGMGTEWHYDLTSTSGITMKTKNVVTSVTKAEKGGWNVIITSYTPQESQNHYHKVSGWVYTDKSVSPAANYTFDFVEDKPDLMNPLVVGKGWDYKGTGSGMAVTQTWKAIAVEEVKVPAGTYKAVRVESEGEMGGNPTKYTFWYADRVGAVKIVTESANPNGPAIVSTSVLTKHVVPKK